MSAVFGWSRERWERVCAAAEKLEGVAPEARRPVLREAFPGDVALHDDVLLLLEQVEPAELHLAGLAERLGLPWRPSSDGTLAGRRIGPYRVIREIGRGGMGAVYEAERADGAFRKRVALKLLPLALSDPVARGRFERERQLLADLDHPGTARLLDGGTTDDGSPYIVMELVEGEPLDVFCREREVTIGERVRLVRDVARTLATVHEQRLVHRDLKPSNILVTPGGDVRLLDFGVAKILSDGDVGGESAWTRLAGYPVTPLYASPEQLRGGEVSPASDVFSLGMILYELVAGVPPFPGDVGGVETRARLIEERSPAPATREAGREAPPVAAPGVAGLSRDRRRDLDAVIARCLHPDPTCRYGMAAEVEGELDRWLEEEPVRTSAPSVPDRLGRVLRRRWLGMLSGTFALGIFLSVFVVIEGRQKGPEPVALPPGPGLIAFHSQRSGNLEIWLTSVDGSGAVNVTNHPSGDRDPDLSPDGSRIAFVSERSGNNDIYVMASDGTDLRRLTDSPSSDQGPAWSPDGRRIAFWSHRDGDAELYVVDADGTGLRRLTTHPRWDTDPDWSPDGEWIVFRSDRAGEGLGDLYLIRPDGSDLRRITDEEGDVVGPRWSPDGSRIVFFGRRGGTLDLFVLHMDGSGVEALTGPPYNEAWPEWSPDGRWIAYHSGGGAGRDGALDVHVMSLDGRERRNLTDHSSLDGSPSWSVHPADAGPPR